MLKIQVARVPKLIQIAESICMWKEEVVGWEAREERREERGGRKEIGGRRWCRREVGGERGEV